ncbi:hypothetical protein BDZ91DRAFT_853328 [Kalaharituber pfeilii]|nr:hypothetical protein BDZ91DRAFT_853328 [Kalaharituber pfeilii]
MARGSRGSERPPGRDAGVDRAITGSSYVTFTYMGRGAGFGGGGGRAGWKRYTDHRRQAKEKGMHCPKGGMREKLRKGDEDIAIMWVKGHRGIPGNEEADRAARIGTALQYEDETGDELPPAAEAGARGVEGSGINRRKGTEGVETQAGTDRGRELSLVWAEGRDVLTRDGGV